MQQDSVHSALTTSGVPSAVHRAEGGENASLAEGSAPVGYINAGSIAQLRVEGFATMSARPIDASDIALYDPPPVTWTASAADTWDMAIEAAATAAEGLSELHTPTPAECAAAIRALKTTAPIARGGVNDAD